MDTELTNYIIGKNALYTITSVLYCGKWIDCVKANFFNKDETICFYVPDEVGCTAGVSPLKRHLQMSHKIVRLLEGTDDQWQHKRKSLK